ncbi:MAG: hypothetical protein ABH952_01575 [Candidatus Omnitrophota bacterium]
MKRSIWFKLTVIMLINAFFCLDLSWAAGNNLKGLHTHLAPPLSINSDIFAKDISDPGEATDTLAKESAEAKIIVDADKLLQENKRTGISHIIHNLIFSALLATKNVIQRFDTLSSFKRSLNKWLVRFYSVSDEDKYVFEHGAFLIQYLMEKQGIVEADDQLLHFIIYTKILTQILRKIGSMRQIREEIVHIQDIRREAVLRGLIQVQDLIAREDFEETKICLIGYGNALVRISKNIPMYNISGLNFIFGKYEPLGAPLKKILEIHVNTRFIQTPEDLERCINEGLIPLYDRANLLNALSLMNDLASKDKNLIKSTDDFLNLLHAVHEGRVEVRDNAGKPIIITKQTRQIYQERISVCLLPYTIGISASLIGSRNDELIRIPAKGSTVAELLTYISATYQANDLSFEKSIILVNGERVNSSVEIPQNANIEIFSLRAVLYFIERIVEKNSQAFPPERINQEALVNFLKLWPIIMKDFPEQVKTVLENRMLPPLEMLKEPTLPNSMKLSLLSYMFLVTRTQGSELSNEAIGDAIDNWHSDVYEKIRNRNLNDPEEIAAIIEQYHLLPELGEGSKENNPTDNEGGFIRKGDRAFKQMLYNLSHRQYRDETDDLKQDIEQIEQRIRKYLHTTAGSEIPLRIIVTDAVVFNQEDDYVLEFYSHAEETKQEIINILGEAKFNELFPEPALVLSRQICEQDNPLIRQEYIYHGAICSVLGHYNAIQKAQNDFFENYPDIENNSQGNLQIALRSVINNLARPTLILPDGTLLRAGDTVKHASFGEGTILTISPNNYVTINFSANDKGQTRISWNSATGGYLFLELDDKKGKERRRTDPREIRFIENSEVVQNLSPDLKQEVMKAIREIHAPEGLEIIEEEVISESKKIGSKELKIPESIGSIQVYTMQSRITELNVVLVLTRSGERGKRLQVIVTYDYNENTIKLNGEIATYRGTPSMITFESIQNPTAREFFGYPPLPNFPPSTTAIPKPQFQNLTFIEQAI